MQFPPMITKLPLTTSRKRGSMLLLALLSVLLLTGCSESYPSTSQDGTAWNEEWTMLGAVLGVEDPGYNFTLEQNPVVLTGDDTFYATWVTGESTEYVNDEEDTVDLYPAEIYALLYGCTEESYADAAIEEWTAKEAETYEITETSEITCNGQTYTLLSYTVDKEDNPYNRGIVAFTRYETYAITVEMSCTASYTEDASEVLVDFLNRCHYSAAKED